MGPLTEFVRLHNWWRGIRPTTRIVLLCIAAAGLLAVANLGYLAGLILVVGFVVFLVGAFRY